MWAHADPSDHQWSRFSNLAGRRNGVSPSPDYVWHRHHFSASVNVTALATFYQPFPNVDGQNTWMADAAHSLYWGGISSVTDANGNAVDFTLASASGTNYLQSFVPVVVTAPVPEPETYALLLAGLGVLGLVRRRGQRTVVRPSAIA